MTVDTTVYSVAKGQSPKGDGTWRFAVKDYSHQGTVQMKGQYGTACIAAQLKARFEGYSLNATLTVLP